MDNKKINTREVLRVKKLNLERRDLKKLKLKHLIPKDKALLSKRLRSDRQDIQRLIDSSLRKTLKDIEKDKGSKIKYEKILGILGDDLRELDSKLKILKRQTKMVSGEKTRLFKMQGIFQKRISKFDKALRAERGRNGILKKEKFRVQR